MKKGPSNPSNLTSPTPPASRSQRLRAGVSQRKHLRRSELGKMRLGKKDRDPIQLLLASEKERLPSLLPIKYQRMSSSPFAFFRGAVPIMAADLAIQPNTGIAVQLCGDAHLQNMGCFAAPDGSLVFDINDFDETIQGPWEWDVKRMATSIILAGRASGHTRAERHNAAEAFVNSYCERIEEFADQPILTSARHQIHRISKVAPISAALQQSERARPLDLLKKYTEPDERGLHFKAVENSLWRVKGKERQSVLQSVLAYKDSLRAANLHLFGFFRPMDVGFKVVGTGSVGLRDYVILMIGNGKRDPLFLQIKQEVHSAYAPYLKSNLASHHGQRVAEGQTKLQPLSDLLLGWTTIGDQHYLVRQLNDHKGNINLQALKGDGLSSLASVAGEILARGHARSGDSLQIKGYIGDPGKLARFILQYAVDYADLTEEDFELFQKAAKNGQIKVTS